MKTVFIVLLFPSVAGAFYKGIPYKETEIYKKIKTFVNLSKIQTRFKLSKAKAEVDKAIVDQAKCTLICQKFMLIYPRVIKTL